MQTCLLLAAEQASLDAQVICLPLGHLVVMRCKVGIDEQQAGVPHVGQGYPHPTLVPQNIPHTYTSRPELNKPVSNVACVTGSTNARC